MQEPDLIDAESVRKLHCFEATVHDLNRKASRFIETSSRPTLTQEYITGGSLTDLSAEGQLGCQEVARSQA